MSTSLGSLALAEIVARHGFFERWFNGEADEGELAECLRNFDPRFCRIDPSGRENDRAALEAGLAARQGSRRQDRVRIAIEEPRLLWQTPDAVLATYVEAQSSQGTDMPERRRSTALLLASMDAGPILWRHVQETSIPTLVQPGGSVSPATTPGDSV